MWTRSELKTQAKASFAPNYWRTVLVTAILTILAGGSSGNSGKNAVQKSGSDILSNPIVVLSIISAVLVFSLVIIAIKIIVGNCLIVGGKKFLVENAINSSTGSDEKASLKMLGYAFQSGKWGNVTLAMFLRGLFIALWTLLFIIPGVVKAYQYRLVPYLLAEDPGMNWKEALETSKDIMDGQKWNTFVLDLSFIGWFLLSGITFGIVGIFWVNPYYYQTRAQLYLALIENK